MSTIFLKECFPGLDAELIREMETYGIHKTFAAHRYIVKQGDYIRYLPMVLSGSIKVFSTENDIRFLLYYIAAGESCIYSFAHTMDDSPAEFSAVAEQDSELLLLPKEKVREWLGKYPGLGRLMLTDYQRHYKDLLNTTRQITVYNLDRRLLDYLQTKAKITGSRLLDISHQEIADDMGSSRETITRIMKKLNLENKVEQKGRRIKVL